MKNVIQYLQSVETEKGIIELINNNIILYKNINTYVKLKQSTEVIYNQFIRECVRNNQYVSFSNTTIKKINDIYKQLVIVLSLLSRKEYSKSDLEKIVKDHRKRLIESLQKNEYEDSKNQLFIPYAEYSAKFQNEILRINSIKLLEPIIDIGCGNEHRLIDLLRFNGYLEVYGLDQFIDNDSKIFCSNWFDYKFQENTWGTIIAHMSFSNHFRRAIISKDENLDTYKQKYQEIIRSLKNHGFFIYSPSVRNIEDALDKNTYKVSYFMNLKDRNLDTVYIQKLI